MTASGSALSDCAATKCPPEYGAVLTADLGAIRRNYRKLREMSGAVETGAVLKGNGYGIGAQDVARALAGEDCTTFFCALISEGEALREILPDADIYVLNGYPSGAAANMRTHRLTPVLGSLAEVERWLADTSKPSSAALMVETGMNRLGLPANALDHPAIGALKERGIAMLMTHLACADDPDDQQNARQLDRFKMLLTDFPGVPASLANSAATITGLARETDLARPGIALYGGRAVSGHANPMEPVVRVDTRIIQTRDVKAGDAVGYSATWISDGNRRIAVVSMGYADGYPRSATGGDGRPEGFAAIDGVRVPLVGRVSMDLITLDVTDLPPETTAPGKIVEMIGPNVTLNDVADAAGTIGYEVLTGLGNRYLRVLLDSEATAN